MKNKIVLIVLIFIGILAMISIGLNGCKSNDLALQLIVEDATVRLLQQHPQWKPQTIVITNEAIALIDNDPNITVAAITLYVNNEIAKNKLTPEEQVLVSIFVETTIGAIQDYLNQQGTNSNSDQVQEIRKVLVWINVIATTT
jgi:hypothetical protein